MKATLLATSLAIASLSGCASIVSGTSQPVSVETRVAGQPVAGAACKLSSNKGTWFVTTPGSVVVHRGFQDLVVECSKEGLTPSITNIASTTRAIAFGNILFGGIIGVAVDTGTGSAYDYPDLITIPMTTPVGASAAAVTTPVVTSTPLPAAPVGAAAASEAVATPVVVAPAVVTAAPQPTYSSPGVQQPIVSNNQPKPQPPHVVWKYQIAAEAYARDLGTCAAKPVAAFVAAGPGFETYSIPCQQGESLIARCEFGHCRTLQ